MSVFCPSSSRRWWVSSRRVLQEEPVFLPTAVWALPSVREAPAVEIPALFKSLLRRAGTRRWVSIGGGGRREYIVWVDVDGKGCANPSFSGWEAASFSITPLVKTLLPNNSRHLLGLAGATPVMEKQGRGCP